MGKYSDRAVELFKEGYNCSQAIFAAFSELYSIDVDTALKISSGFGGGMGRMREVCGAFSAAVMIAGMENGSADSKDVQAKTDIYKFVQEMAERFKQENGSIICKELLGLSKPEVTHVPEKRTEQYYKKRPCVKIVEETAKMIEDMIINNK